MSIILDGTSGITLPGIGTQAQIGSMTTGTAQTASGTAVNFTDIPSWVKRITVMLSGVSTSGTSVPIVQLGTSSGVSTTGYSSGFNTFGATSTSSVTGFVFGGTAATNTTFGHLNITNVSGNTWVYSGVCYNGGISNTVFAGGVTLATLLDRLRVTTTNGTDTFDAGTVNIMYE